MVGCRHRPLGVDTRQSWGRAGPGVGTPGFMAVLCTTNYSSVGSGFWVTSAAAWELAERWPSSQRSAAVRNLALFPLGPGSKGGSCFLEP